MVCVAGPGSWLAAAHQAQGLLGVAASVVTAFPLAFGEAGQISHPLCTSSDHCAVPQEGMLVQGEGQGPSLPGMPLEMLLVSQCIAQAALALPLAVLGLSLQQ